MYCIHDEVGGGGGDMFSSENSINFCIDLLKCHIFVLKNCVYKT